MAYTKVEPGDAAYLADFPQMCVCGSQKGPMVATLLDKPGYGHVYLCRLCVAQSARALGMVKGDEMDRLQAASDELAHAAEEITQRQALIDKLTASLSTSEGTRTTQAAYIATLQAEITQYQHVANQIRTMAGEMATVSS